MKIIVNPHTLQIIKEEIVNEREIDISKCVFEFDEEITNEYVKEAYFTLKDKTYKQLIINNECSFPSEVLEEKGQIEIGVVAYLVESEEEIKRYNPRPAYFTTTEGSLKDNAENTEPITPTDKEQIEQAITSLQTNKADKTEIPDVSDFITKEVNNLTNYTLGTETGSSIEMSIDTTTYVLTISLKNSDNQILNTQTVDLPIESMIVNGSYDSINKKIILTLQNGNIIEIPVGDLINGLQAEITSDNKLSSDLVDDTNNTHKFVSASEKQIWNNKYDKSANGIPKTDLSSEVQTSLGKADTALQNEIDPIFSASASANITSTDITNWNNKQDKLTAGNNITIENNVISATGGSGGTSDYSELTNKPSINNVTLSGNKTTSDLGIVIPDVSNFITKNVDDLTYYTKTSNLSSVATSGNYNDLSNKPTIPTVPTNVSAFTNDVGYLTQHQDISGKLDTSKVKTTYSTTSGDVYEVSYINTLIGDISDALDVINGEVIS